ncbi:uncharacterized protein [Aegilops tauschii subsp. strangulata]|uniref:uncharacterized protein n=1 Tax=Aegilops tauschii subsp. strangulata TaxID=200361 RepID=UPI001ABCC7FD|nr:uncharacterized protein LOC120963233 [Aegilops tauschii subsp. strangulata]
MGKTDVLLNGIPGNWIQCKKGMRQGDPASLYLFLIVADLLQQLIIQNPEPDLLHHPIFTHLPPTILQYADDTLIIAAVSPLAAATLKIILNNFAQATGLTINFSKTTLATLHTDETLADAAALAMECSRAPFPQIYLGLPLAPTKPPSNAGTHRYFWLDTWLTPKPLATTFPHLFSHSTLQLVKVANILRLGIEANLRNHLSLTTERELASLLAVLQDFTPWTEEDQRFLLQGHDFSTKQAYGTLMTKPDTDPIAPLIWGTKVPRKIKIFAWLLFKDRLNSAVNLAHKHIISSNICPRCATSPEDSTHIFITCPLANRIWQRLGLLPLSDDLNELWDTSLPQNLPTNAWSFVLLALL